MANDNFLFQQLMAGQMDSITLGHNVGFSPLVFRKMVAALVAARYPGLEEASKFLGVDAKGALGLVKAQICKIIEHQGVTGTETMMAIGTEWSEDFSKMFSVLGNENMFVYDAKVSQLLAHVSYYLEVGDPNTISKLGNVFGNALVARISMQMKINARRAGTHKFRTYSGPYKSVNAMVYQGDCVKYETDQLLFVGIPVVYERPRTLRLIRVLVMPKQSGYLEKVYKGLLSGQLINWFGEASVARNPVLIPIRDDLFGVDLSSFSQLIGANGRAFKCSVFPNLVMRVDDRVIPNGDTVLTSNEVNSWGTVLRVLKPHVDLLFDPTNKLVLSATFVNDFFGREVSV